MTSFFALLDNIALLKWGLFLRIEFAPRGENSFFRELITRVYP